jgi:glutathione S-transferase
MKPLRKEDKPEGATQEQWDRFLEIYEMFGPHVPRKKLRPEEIDQALAEAKAELAKILAEPEEKQ